MGKRPSSGPKAELVRLPNGVRIAFDPMPGLASFAAGIWVKAGARHEAPQENGVAHLFEHMAFKGAGGLDAGAFARKVEAVGGAMNAATSYERTAYYARMLEKDAGLAVDLLCDIVFDASYDAEELEKEKGVVLQEQSEAFDLPDDRVFELHQAEAFAGHALGRPILGDAHSVPALTRKDLIQFKNAWTSPDRIVAAFAGAYDRDLVLARLEARLGRLRAKKVERHPPRFTGPPPGPARLAHEPRRLAQSHLTFSLSGPSAPAKDAIAARLLAEILGGGMSSRLFQEVREKRGLAYAIDAHVDQYEDCGRIGIYAGCAAKDAAKVAQIVAQTIADLAEAGPTADELARAKAVAKAGLLMGAESPMSRAEARAGQIFLRDRLLSLAEIADWVESVDAEALRAVARDAIEAGSAACAHVGPQRGLAGLETFAARFSF